MASRRDNEAQMDELGDDPGQAGPDSGGQSGDTQGLSEVADAADESVQELADTGQAYEAEVIEGVEDAADHPERPVHTHEDQSRPPAIAPEHVSK
jgi:hypothetical protein